MSQDWAAQELAGIDLGDARLNKRSVTLLDRLADKLSLPDQYSPLLPFEFSPV